MKIKVTGCINCPFRQNYDGLYWCRLSDITLTKEINICDPNKNYESFNENIPKECPAKQGQKFTIIIQ